MVIGTRCRPAVLRCLFNLMTMLEARLSSTAAERDCRSTLSTAASCGCDENPWNGNEPSSSASTPLSVHTCAVHAHANAAFRSIYLQALTTRRELVRRMVFELPAATTVDERLRARADRYAPHRRRASTGRSMASVVVLATGARTRAW